MESFAFSPPSLLQTSTSVMPLAALLTAMWLGRKSVIKARGRILSDTISDRNLLIFDFIA
jgi:phosphopantetheinyl transferase